MGSYWLHDLDDVVRDAGLDCRTWGGWETRSRSSGGYDRVWAVFAHHTASNTAPDNDAAYMWNNAEDRPIGALLLERSGRVTIGAAGATNTQGKGGACPVSHGTIPLDKGNAYGIAVEAANDGCGEPWPDAQQRAYVTLVAALCDAYGLDPNRDVLAHFEWVEPSCPGRKTDPAGNSRYASGGAKWNMDAFRADVIAGAPSGTPPPPTPEPEPEPEPEPPPDTDEGTDDMAAIMPTIKRGQSGPYVERMQHLLAAAGYMNPTNGANYDGVWGDGTDDAKARFDNDHGLTPSPPTDCGAKSWESLLTGKKW